jgi:hypothetical protein
LTLNRRRRGYRVTPGRGRTRRNRVSPGQRTESALAWPQSHRCSPSTRRSDNNRTLPVITWAGNESRPDRIRADQHLCSGHLSQPAHPPSRLHWSTLTVIGHRRLPHGPGTAQAAPSAAEGSASILTAPVMQHGRPSQCGLPDVAGDLRIQFAEIAFIGITGRRSSCREGRAGPGQHVDARDRLAGEVLGGEDDQVGGAAVGVWTKAIT